jgi:hypothetical protein
VQLFNASDPAELETKFFDKSVDPSVRGLSLHAVSVRHTFRGLRSYPQPDLTTVTPGVDPGHNKETTMATIYIFDVGRLQLLDGHLTVGVLAATQTEDLEDFEVTVLVVRFDADAFNPEHGGFEALELESFCEVSVLQMHRALLKDLASTGFSIWEDAGYPQELDANGAFGSIFCGASDDRPSLQKGSKSLAGTGGDKFQVLAFANTLRSGYLCSRDGRWVQFPTAAFPG